jgi:hypothetical protein
VLRLPDAPVSWRATLAAAGAIVAFAAAATPASADVGWHFGPLLETTINDCYTFDVVNGVGEYAGARYDENSPPKTGEVFYVNVVVNGIDASCAEITFPEIKVPDGVAVAISAQNPIKCFTVDNRTVTETPDTADCPQSLGAPLYGGTGSIRNVNGPPPGTWDTRAPNAWEFQIPLSASTGGMKEITFPTQVISGSITQMLEPAVSLPVDGPSIIAPRRFAIVPRTKTARLSRKGALAFSVVPGESATATAAGTISVRGASRVVRFVRRKVSLVAHKPTRVTLKLKQKDARLVRAALKRHSKLKAKISLTAKAANGDTATKRLAIGLRG